MGQARNRGPFEIRRQQAVDAQNRTEGELRAFLAEVIAAREKHGIHMLPTRHLNKQGHPARLVLVEFDRLRDRLEGRADQAAAMAPGFTVGPEPAVEDVAADMAGAVPTVKEDPHG